MKNRFKILTILVIGVAQMSSMTMAMVTTVSKTAPTVANAAGAMAPSLVAAYQSYTNPTNNLYTPKERNDFVDYVIARNQYINKLNDTYGPSTSGMAAGMNADIAAKYPQSSTSQSKQAPIDYNKIAAGFAKNNSSPFKTQTRGFATSTSDGRKIENVTFDTLKSSLPVLPKEIFASGPVERVKEVAGGPDRILGAVDFKGPNDESITELESEGGLVMESSYIKGLGNIKKEFDAQGKLLSVELRLNALTDVYYNADGTINKILVTDADQKERKEYYSVGGVVKTFGPSNQFPDLLINPINSSNDYQGWSE